MPTESLKCFCCAQLRCFSLRQIWWKERNTNSLVDLSLLICIIEAFLFFFIKWIGNFIVEVLLRCDTCCGWGSVMQLLNAICSLHFKARPVEKGTVCKLAGCFCSERGLTQSFKFTVKHFDFSLLDLWLQCFYSIILLHAHEASYLLLTEL